MNDFNATEQLVQTLAQSPTAFPHPIESIELIETHISWIILTGPFVYKIKKPVDFGFIDYSSLVKRADCCLLELKLNQRLAPLLYLRVASICGPPSSPHVEWDETTQGNVVEYAVVMHQFAQSSLLSLMTSAGDLCSHHIDLVALTLADFHAELPGATPESPYGLSESQHHCAQDNFNHIERHVTLPSDELTSIKTWTETEFGEIRPRLNRRRKEGMVRECHGDLHLGNMAWIDEQPVFFDCIEFNANLRWIDVMSEVAFVVMDLQDRGLPPLAARFLNLYLARSGDYDGLGVLRYFMTYRAMVRAKVAVLRATQKAGVESSPDWDEYHCYLSLAHSLIQANSPAVLLTHGPSGVGKSTVAAQLVEDLGAIQIRSDVERKRLFPHLDKESLYGVAAGTETMDRLESCCVDALSLKIPVILDATFLNKKDRDRFRELAEERCVPFLILDVQAPPATARERIITRIRENKDPSDADLDVLESQLKRQEPLDASEQACAVMLDSSLPCTWKTAVEERLNSEPDTSERVRSEGP